MPQRIDESVPWGWAYAAKCRDIKADTEIFYPDRDINTYKVIAGKARDICWGRDGAPACPVRKKCLLHAVRTDEKFGIFGGLSHRERNVLLRRWRKEAPESSFEDYVMNS